MRPTFPILALLLALPLLGNSGCDADDDDDDAGVCENEDRAVPYEAGMEIDGDEGALSLSLDAAVPDPPDLGDNDWTLTVSEAAGGAKAGCVLTATPWMVDHGHGSNEPVSAATDAAGGTLLEELDLIMPGYWTIAVEAVCDDGTEDRFQFDFCVEG
ncbi:MAG: hypothetical protein GY898_31765 [Proteobacteria bacterium]|nr:hypothetical protein [Pseudomonadota bacterium]